MSFDPQTWQLLVIAILPTLFAIVVHEVAHGWVAWRLGDTTAYMMGRLTLNPLKHIDPVGTVIVPVLMIMTLGFAFGWAKPVPINPHHLRQPRRDIVLVTAAGPASNLLMAILWAILAKIASILPASMSYLSVPLYAMGIFGILINTILMVFNLLPIPPTDGGRIATMLLPGKLGLMLSRLEPYGMIIIVILLVSNLLWKIIGPVVYEVTHLIQLTVGLI